MSNKVMNWWMVLTQKERLAIIDKAFNEVNI